MLNSLRGLKSTWSELDSQSHEGAHCHGRRGEQNCPCCRWAVRFGSHQVLVQLPMAPLLLLGC